MSWRCTHILDSRPSQILLTLWYWYLGLLCIVRLSCVIGSVGLGDTPLYILIIYIWPWTLCAIDLGRRLWTCLGWSSLCGYLLRRWIRTLRWHLVLKIQCLLTKVLLNLLLLIVKSAHYTTRDHRLLLATGVTFLERIVSTLSVGFWIVIGILYLCVAVVIFGATQMLLLLLTGRAPAHDPILAIRLPIRPGRYALLRIYNCGLHRIDCDVLCGDMLLLLGIATWNLLNMVNINIIYPIVIIPHIKRQAVFIH